MKLGYFSFIITLVFGTAIVAEVLSIPSIVLREANAAPCAEDDFQIDGPDCGP
ncbi:uncharacterized protein STEHIDRAFT_155051 [Stereum hirsutum FP-91666 SS1]|uniref:uncharacterized protein n=1 Tax=Stereum hirsutum (strain FP-91666) TaxID=721885 RepID=UPI000440AA60|nr:uncharacterized protein STEHIDRAFT_155051 [Stereum hirsutum FP-91666 SS1]EIM89383.1 hypothetical protein STEHIDRAFT_155051 [Stereum hirsutum FP-91666 SS1]